MRLATLNSLPNNNAGRPGGPPGGGPSGPPTSAVGPPRNWLQEWTERTPLVTRYAVLIVLIVTLPCLFVESLNSALVMNAYAITGIQLWRFATALADQGNFLGLLFAILILATAGPLAEKSLGSLRFFLFVLVFGALINLLWVCIMLVFLTASDASASFAASWFGGGMSSTPGAATGDGSIPPALAWKMLSTAGLFPIFLAVITANALSDPQGSTPCCGRWPIPNRIYPWFLLAIFCLLSFSIRLELLLGVLLGHFYTWGWLRFMTPTKNTIERWEAPASNAPSASDGAPVTAAQRVIAVLMCPVRLVTGCFTRNGGGWAYRIGMARSSGYVTASQSLLQEGGQAAGPGGSGGPSLFGGLGSRFGSSGTTGESAASGGATAPQQPAAFGGQGNRLGGPGAAARPLPSAPPAASAASDPASRAAAAAAAKSRLAAKQQQEEQEKQQQVTSSTGADSASAKKQVSFAPEVQSAAFAAPQKAASSGSADRRSLLKAGQDEEDAEGEGEAAAFSKLASAAAVPPNQKPSSSSSSATAPPATRPQPATAVQQQQSSSFPLAYSGEDDDEEAASAPADETLEIKLAQLASLGLGDDRARCIEALNESNGDVDMAALLLSSGSSASGGRSV